MLNNTPPIGAGQQAGAPQLASTRTSWAGGPGGARGASFGPEAQAAARSARAPHACQLCLRGPPSAAASTASAGATQLAAGAIAAGAGPLPIQTSKNGLPTALPILTAPTPAGAWSSCTTAAGGCWRKFALPDIRYKVQVPVNAANLQHGIGAALTRSQRECNYQQQPVFRGGCCGGCARAGVRCHL
jgi:hypothetical protein